MKEKKGTRATIGGAGVLLLSKLKFLAVLLKFIKFKTLISMILSLGAYALLYGWKFGAVIVYLLFVHEMGHAFAAKRKGIPTSPTVFIPLFGAFVAMKENSKTLKDDAFISIMGPFAGLLSIIPFIVLYYMTGTEFWLHMFQVGAILNLFNLLPMMPFDGGRVARALSTKLLIIGFIVFLAFTVVNPDPILVIISVFGIMYFIGAIVERYGWEEKTVYKAEYEKALHKWNALREEWNAVEPEGRLTWLNVKLYEEGRVLTEYEQQLNVLKDKKSSWRWTRDTEAYKRSEGKVIAQRQIMREMEMWYDREPEQLHSIQKELHELAEDIQKKEAYEKLSGKDRIVIFVQYVGLVLVLSGCIAFAIMNI
jgi:Zn-dependent protease